MMWVFGAQKLADREHKTLPMRVYGVQGDNAVMAPLSMEFAKTQKISSLALHLFYGAPEFVEWSSAFFALSQRFLIFARV